MPLIHARPGPPPRFVDHPLTLALIALAAAVVLKLLQSALPRVLPT
jgi:hypothetical protein